MKLLSRKLAVIALAVVGMVTLRAEAGVVITGTRVIFPGQEREVTVQLTNEGESPALIQTWIDRGDPNEPPEKIDVPFVLAPAMFRLDPKKGQTLRLIRLKAPLAQDKESLFWLNVLEVPPKAKAGQDANRLQLAYRTRIKVMSRPEGFAGQAEEAPALLRWALVRTADGKGQALRASNATPYVVNLGGVALKSSGQAFDAGAGPVKPGESALFAVQGFDAQASPDAEVEYTSINDWGGGVPNRQPLSARETR
ncbi:molecular chaperone [Variovorax boronicumulans]|uniref:fimbrial biogenesis chaperone n=1 Tax=Variovorax boronicumulans TaxID=436515 RepID=UPI0036F1A218